MATLTAPPMSDTQKRLIRGRLLIALLEQRMTVDQFVDANRAQGLCKTDPRWDMPPVAELQELTR